MNKIFLSAFILSLNFLFFSAPFVAKVFAVDETLYERQSNTSVKVGVNNIQPEDFTPPLPAQCDSGLNNDSWHLEYLTYQTFNISENENVIIPSVEGMHPQSLEHTFAAENNPNNYGSLGNVYLYQTCDDGNHTLVITEGLDLPVFVRILADTGELFVNLDNNIEVSAESTDFGILPQSFDWDLDNNGSFETAGNLTTFSALGLSPGNYTVRVKASYLGGFYGIDKQAITVRDLPYDEFDFESSTYYPDQVFESGIVAFSNPENTLVEDGQGAIEEENENFNTQLFLLFSEPPTSAWPIKAATVILKVKNTGIQPALIGINVGTDGNDGSQEPCEETLEPSAEYTSFSCTTFFGDGGENNRQIEEVIVKSLLNNQGLDIDSVALKYIYTERLPNITVDPGGPYEVESGQVILLTAMAQDDKNRPPLVFEWDLDNDGEFDVTGQEINFDSNGFALGENTITVKATRATGASATNETTVNITTPQNNGPITLYPTQDSYIKQGGQNENEGGSPMLRLQSSGKNRGLVQFSQEEIDQAIGTSENYTATLQFTITNNGNNWGANGRTIDIHRLTNPWIEGNGYLVGNQPTFRGTGAGATWNCGIDNNTANQTDDCSSTWNMTNSSSWPFITSPSATTTITNNQSGVVEIDVTGDIQEYMNGTDNFGWVVKKTDEGANGRVEFGSRETSNPPTLVIIFN